MHVPGNGLPLLRVLGITVESAELEGIVAPLSETVRKPLFAGHDRLPLYFVENPKRGFGAKVCGEFCYKGEIVTNARGRPAALLGGPYAGRTRAGKAEFRFEMVAEVARACFFINVGYLDLRPDWDVHDGM